MNKSIIIIIIGVLAALAGCKHERGLKLDELEELIATNPDSSFMVLSELQNESKHFCEEDRMRYGLLRLKCQNILDLPFDSEDTISTIVDYYSRKGSYNDVLLSTYLMGRSYMIKGNEPMAMEYFNKCLSLDIPSDEDIDNIQLSKVHSQLDQIFRDQNIPHFQIKELRAAESCALSGRDTLLALNYIYLQTIPYLKIGKLDSVICISQDVREKYLSLGLKDKAADVLCMQLNAYVEKKEYGKAKDCMEIFERESGAIDANGDILPGREIYYYLKGRMYEGLGQIDSAEYQYRRLLKHNKDINNFEGAYKGLLSVYRSRGNRDSIGKYADLYCEANDTAHAHKLSSDISRMKAIYDYSEYRRKTEEMRLQAEETKGRMIVVGSITAILIICLSFGIYSYRRRKQAEIARLLEEYDRNQQMIEDLHDDKEEMIQRHQTELETIRKSLNTKGIVISSESSDSMIEAELAKRFKDYGENTNSACEPITTEEWHRLFTEMSNIDSKFMLLLREANLSENEKKVAILIRLRFKDYQIKNILDTYGSSLTNYKARVNKKLFNEPSAKTLRRMVYGWNEQDEI